MLLMFFFEIETFRLEEYSPKFGCCCIPYFISSICVDIVGYQKQRHKCSGNHTVTEEESGDSINKKCLIIGSVHWKIQSRRTWLGWWSLSQFFCSKSVMKNDWILFPTVPDNVSHHWVLWSLGPEPYSLDKL